MESPGEDAERDRAVRKLIFDRFVETSRPPLAEEVALELGIRREEVERAFESLERAHHIQRVPGTHRILMAFPFSAVATPYKVALANGQVYFANCAWDALAFHVMLRQPVDIRSFCDVCGQSIALLLRGGRPEAAAGTVPLVFLGLPPKDWWSNIVHTCSNTMVFWDASEHLSEFRKLHPETQGQAVSVETMLALSEPLYATKLDRNYERPSRERLREVYASLGLQGPFWDA